MSAAWRLRRRGCARRAEGGRWGRIRRRLVVIPTSWRARGGLCQVVLRLKVRTGRLDILFGEVGGVWLGRICVSFRRLRLLMGSAGGFGASWIRHGLGAQ